MKKQHLRACLLLTLAVILPTIAFAQLTALENGKVYRFTNKANTNIAMATSGLNEVSGQALDESKITQLWYATVTGESFTLRNLATGTYLKGNGQSSYWQLTTDNTVAEAQFKLTTVDTYNVFKSDAHGGYGYCHYATSQSGRIVGWTTSDASQWTITLVEKTEEEIEQCWEDAEDLAPTDEKKTAIQEALYAIFTDKACTTLYSNYSSKSDEELEADANYTALPTTLQEMVKKVRDNKWEEENGVSGKESWNDEYAKKFRVQMYEPYSTEGEITSFLRINAHNNMDNPTGIFANSLQTMYIMVEGEIADGAELWVAHINGHGQLSYYNSSHHTELKEGLNIVPYFSDGSALWIDYVVHTYNSSGTDDATRFPHKLSDYKPLKIHIEGGHINGYYNATGDYRATATSTDNLWGEVDNDDDWDYYKERASLADFTLLGHRQTLQFDLNSITDNDGNTQNGLLYHLENISVPSKPYNNSGLWTDYTDMNLDPDNGKINIMLEAWDRIMYSELATMGVLSDSQMEKMNDMYPRWTAEGEKAEVYDYTGTSHIDNKTYREYCGGIDYSEYFNHHGVALGAYSGYMSGGWKNCNYHYNTMSSIIGKIAVEAGPTWGPAHEIGHQHQGIINLNGQTEVTNNFYSNVAVWYMGMGTSRVNGSEGSLQSVLAAYNTEGNDAYTNNIWALTQMYYRLWLYYHLAGNNTQFWPRVMELCRRDPLQNGAQISGKESLLKFYKHCCVASGEDLTEFFRAHGYLEVMENRLVGDYSNGTYNQTQEDIDQVVAEVKAMNLPQNLAVLFINDATGDTGVSHDGTTSRGLWDGSATAETGSYLDFVDGSVSLSEYTATMNSDGTMTMSGGEGATGFLILDENGQILAFSNKSTFTLSEEAMSALMEGTATVSQVSTDGEVTESEVDLQAIYKGLLESLMNEAKATLLELVDDGSYSHIGFYMSSVAEGLRTALATAQTAIDSGTGYGAAYEVLKSEHDKFLALLGDEYKIPLSLTGTFIIKSRRNETMYLNDSQLVSLSSSADESADATRWQFIESDTEGEYYIKSVSGYYLPKVTQSTSITATQVDSLKAKYTVEDLGMGIGLYAIKVSPEGEYTNLHDPGHSPNKVVGWTKDAANSQWYLTKVEHDAATLNTLKLEELIAQTQELTSKVYFEAPLQTTNASGEYYLYSNANIAEGSLTNLLDDDNTSYMHTVWSGNTADELNHYLRVYLGEETSLSSFNFEYVTRTNENNEKPKTMTIAGCATEDGEYTTIATLTDLPSASTQTYTSNYYDATGYKYLRFMVDDTYRNLYDGNNHKVYSMAEFSLTVVPEEYASAKDLAITANEKIATALTAIEAANETEITTAYEALEEAYKALKEAIEAIDDVALEAEKAKLQTLIDETTELINTVGTAKIEGAKKIDLTGKLYADTPYTGSNTADVSTADTDYNLLDGDTDTYFMSQYPNTSEMSTEPYIRVDLGDGNSMQKFYFNYTTTPSTTKFSATYSNIQPTPDIIKVYGSEDGTTYSDVIVTLSYQAGNNALPSTASTSWSSEEITADKAYRYYKFAVTQAGLNRSKFSGHPTFGLSEFGMQSPAVYEVTVNDDYSQLVSEELLATTQTKVNNATSILTMAATAEQIQTQYDLLLAQKNSLSDAMNDMSGIKAELKTLIDNTTELYNKMAVVTDGTTTVNSNYIYTAVDIETLETAATELSEAQTVYDTEGLQITDVNNAYSELDACYQQLLAWENDNMTDRTELSDLLSETQTLLSELVTLNETETTVALQTTDPTGDYYIWTNAQSSQEGPIAYLIDGIADTHFHSDYSGATPTDRLSNHHLTVNLGYNAISSFKFYYQARANVGYDYPKTILVQGSTNGIDYTDLATVSPVDSDGNTPTNNDEYTSEEISCGDVSYSYLRFVVTETTTSRSPYLYFHMAEFDLISTSEISVNDNYQSPNIPIDYVIETLAEKTEKQAMHDSEHLSAENYEAAVATLKEIVETLTIAKKYAALPVKLTTDTENPILYNILINRSDYDKSVLEYDATSQMVAVKNLLLGKKEQGWYFTLGNDGKVNIVPWQGEGKMLSTNSYSEGNSKVLATEAGTSGYGYDWNISEITGSEWYNITIDHVTTETAEDGTESTTTETYYFSNHGGVSQKMGFYNTNPSTDGGSMFKFELGDFDKSEAYYTLYNYCNAELPYSTVGTGNGLGCYSNGDVYNTAYSDATTALETTDSEDDTYTTAYNTLKSAYEALIPNEAVDGGYYVFRQAKHNAFAYAHTDNKMYWSTSKTTTDASAIWKLTKVDGGYNFTNLNTGTNMIALVAQVASPLSSDGNVATVALKEIGEGQFNIKVGNTWMHSQESEGNPVVSWGSSNDKLNNNSAWHIEPVDVTTTLHNLTISSVGWASLHLNYAVNIPEGVRAFTSVEGIDGDYALLEEIEDGIIPANTGVLLKGAADSYEFTYATTETTYEDNLFAGTNYDIYVEASNSYQYFVLAIGSSGNAALCYIMKEVALNDSGSYVFTANTDEGTHFKLPAHKVYLPVAGNTNIKSFGFRVIGGATGTTDIEGVCGEIGTTESIYDLSGRRLNEITAPGIYIINGNKVLVNEVKN